jgi:hypothetical protein
VKVTHGTDGGVVNVASSVQTPAVTTGHSQWQLAEFHVGAVHVIVVGIGVYVGSQVPVGGA